MLTRRERSSSADLFFLFKGNTTAGPDTSLALNMVLGPSSLGFSSKNSLFTHHGRIHIFDVVS